MKATALLIVTLITITIAPTLLFAAEETDCAVHYTRTACDGQETISYKKCDGEQSCTKYKPANSVEECQAAATKSCANSRLDITKSKVITATYQGSEIQDTNGESDFCLAYENKGSEFNQCPEDQ